MKTPDDRRVVPLGLPSAIFLSQMFLLVIPHDWQCKSNAWIANETGWLKQAEHSVKARLLRASGKAGRALMAKHGIAYCISRREMICFTVWTT